MKNILRLSVVSVFGIFLFVTGLQELNLLMAFAINIPIIAILTVIIYSEQFFSKKFLNKLAGWALGILGGLLAAYLAQNLIISQTSFTNQEMVNRLLSSVLVIFFAVLGSRISMLLGRSQTNRFSNSMENVVEQESLNYDQNANLLDSSVIIDGRIVEIAESGFIDGPFIVPNFVLREIQLICDSADSYKRSRGRRGLEMLAKLRENPHIKVKITYQDYKDVHEVDAKLIRASRDSNARLVTNDFNLNKIAELQGIRVLNLNTLTNVLKTIVLPGEEVDINIVKEGRDENQGIGYLVDGTMVVVENGERYIGQQARVVVNSVIQTSAGKLVFTRFEKALGEFDAEEYKVDSVEPKQNHRRKQKPREKVERRR